MDQVAQQQFQPGRVGLHAGRQVGGHVQYRHRPRCHLVQQALHQRGQVHSLLLQRAVAGGHALAFEQAVDQVAHLRQVLKQRIALRAVVHQFGVQPGAGQGAAQFMADGQQQPALGLQHALQRAGHGVDALRQVAPSSPLRCGGMG